MFEKWKKSKEMLSESVTSEKEDYIIPEGIDKNLKENILKLRELFGKSFDLVIKESESNSVKIAFAALDGMYDGIHASQAVIEPVQTMKFSCTEPDLIYDHLCSYCAAECDTKEAITINQATELILSGFIVLFVDGVTRCKGFSVQGYPRRSVEPPESETQENGSREGFVDMYKDNVTLVRRRLKTPFVRFETIIAGETSNTTLVVCYHSKRADPQIVNKVKEKLKNIKNKF